MNFLAHFVVADRCPPLAPAFVVGNALPDLLPLAAPRLRLRPAALVQASDGNGLRAGVLTHLAADAAFHKTTAFADAQAEIRVLLSEAGFVGIRVRAFFLSHVLVELALDAALLRADPSLAHDFYAHFGRADFAAVARWTETAVGVPLPHLPGVLSRFAGSRYLFGYETDGGLAEGISRLCARARQDTFDGENRTRLERLAGKSVAAVATWKTTLLQETAAGMHHG